MDPAADGRADGLGDRLRALRASRTLSQADLAGDDLSASYVSLVEAGRRVPSPAVLAALAARLGVTAGFLATGREEDHEVQARADLAFLRVALENGEHGVVLERAAALRSSTGPDWPRRDELDYLLACAHEATGALEDACRLLEPVARRAREGTTEVPLARCHLVLAGCYLEAGDAGRGAEVADLGLAAAEERGWTADPDLARLAATSVWAYLERGDALYAALKAQEHLARLPDDAPLTARAGLLWNEALARNALGQHRAALALLGRASALMAEGDGGRDAARGQMALAWLMLRGPEPDTEAVLTVLRAAHERLLATQATIDLATCELELARAHLLVDDPRRAVGWAEQARARLGPGHRALSADAASLLARARLAVDPADDVGDLLDEVDAHLLRSRPSRSSAVAWAQLADVLEDAGRTDRALVASRRALEAAGVHVRWAAVRPGALQPSPPP